MKRITIHKGNDKLVFDHPVTAAEVMDAVSKWWPQPSFMDQLAVEAFCEAVAADGIRRDFGELCSYLKVWVTWTPVAKQGALW